MKFKKPRRCDATTTKMEKGVRSIIRLEAGRIQRSRR